MRSFGTRLAEKFSDFGHLSVGIDPHAALLAEWGEDYSAVGLREFGLRVVEAAVSLVGMVKVQVSLFEAHGSAGFAALERVLAEARGSELLVIADAKRGDIGSSNEGYLRAWLTPGSPLEADALTVNPYLGLATLSTFSRPALASGKGLFILSATSNREAWTLQAARLDRGTRTGDTVAAAAFAGARQLEALDNTRDAGTTGADQVGRGLTGQAPQLGSIGVVLGATAPFEDLGIDVSSDPETPLPPILAPGFGVQGAETRDYSEIFGSLSPAVIVSASRSLLAAGRDGVRHAIARAADEAR